MKVGVVVCRPCDDRGMASRGRFRKQRRKSAGAMIAGKSKSDVTAHEWRLAGDTGTSGHVPVLLFRKRIRPDPPVGTIRSRPRAALTADKGFAGGLPAQGHAHELLSFRCAFEGDSSPSHRLHHTLSAIKPPDNPTCALPRQHIFCHFLHMPMLTSTTFTSRPAVGRS